MKWLRDMKPIHCIFVRVFDDTNIWVTPETGPPRLEDVDEDVAQADKQEVREQDEEEEGLSCWAVPGGVKCRRCWECCNGLLPDGVRVGGLPPILLNLCSFLPLRKSCRRQVIGSGFLGIVASRSHQRWWQTCLCLHGFAAVLLPADIMPFAADVRRLESGDDGSAIFSGRGVCGCLAVRPPAGRMVLYLLGCEYVAESSLSRHIRSTFEA